MSIKKRAWLSAKATEREASWWTWTDSEIFWECRRGGCVLKKRRNSDNIGFVTSWKSYQRASIIIIHCCFCTVSVALLTGTPWQVVAYCLKTINTSQQLFVEEMTNANNRKINVFGHRRECEISQRLSGCKYLKRNLKFFSHLHIFTWWIFQTLLFHSN